MEIHKVLGKGLLEIVYKDAIEYEFSENKIPFTREKEFDIKYKNIFLKHKFYADFVVYDNIILEVKAINYIPDECVKQTLNYLGISKCKLGLIVNFGSDSLQYKRLVL